MSEHSSSSAESSSAEQPLRVVVYSDDRTTREQVRVVLGRRLAADLAEITLVEVATAPELIRVMDAGGVDLAVLDGEATPAGGMGMARQLRDEIEPCPPIVVLVARPQDAWLATWSLADAAVPYPLDPITFPRTLAEVLRRSLASTDA